MANTYTQLHIQFVFAVQNRISLIQPSWEEELFKYTTGIVKNHKHKMIAINGVPDHIYLFVGLHPTQSISNLMQVVKGETSECPPAGTGRDKQEKLCKREVSMARRVWSIFLWS